jgi:DNA repair photolyase
MKNKLVMVPSIKEPIQKSPGFAKKELATYKLDLMGLCGFGCSYCSSNAGNYLRINRERFADMTEAQLGERLLPATSPDLSFMWPDVLDRLRTQLDTKPRTWGAGDTLVVSQLTDAFSPQLLLDGITQAALALVLNNTSFRMRILTKNSIVGAQHWINFFRSWPGRFVVGLSTGTLDNEWARRVEAGTSSPQARIRATRALQDAGVPTFGMLCPIFPDVLSKPHQSAASLEDLIKAIRPDLCETVWAEPYNDRSNWQAVQAGYDVGSFGWRWFSNVFGDGRLVRGWSSYATQLYTRLRDIAERDGWLPKLKYLLYEDGIAAEDAPDLAGLRGVLLQSKPADEKTGRSANMAVAALQAVPQ